VLVFYQIDNIFLSLVVFPVLLLTVVSLKTVKNMARQRWSNEVPELEEDSSVLLSIGDMMSGLLMIFALLFLTVLVKITEMSEPRRVVIGKVIEAMDANNIDVEINPETGDVSIKEGILFSENSAELKPEGKEFLDSFIPPYSEIIFSEEIFDREITRVIIEGHTSSRGSYQYNMELSLLRALSVADYIFSDDFVLTNSQQFSQKIMTAGRGEIEARADIDDPDDRRVTFRFQFRGEDFSELYKELQSVGDES